MLNEQSGRERTQTIRSANPAVLPRSGGSARANWIAFGSGLLLSFFTANSILSYLGSGESDISFPIWTAWIPFQISPYFFLLLPLALGIVVPITVGIQSKTLLGSSLGRSTLVWAGAGLYWFPLAVFEDEKWTLQAQADCVSVNYHGWCGFHLGSGGLFFYLFFAGLLILLFALFTALMMKLVRKYSHLV
ncbi:MAG TPA: hypothetical protein VF458_08985 [Ktedonobacteraceae bacterium]